MEILRKKHNLLVVEGCRPNKVNVKKSLQDMELKIVSGYFEFEDNIYQFSDDLEGRDIFLSELIKDSGQWFGYFSSFDGKESIICSDFYGFSTIFYATVPTSRGGMNLIVSDSFRAISTYLHKQGIQGKLNWDVILPHLITNTNLFLTRASNETFHQNINTLNYDDIIYFNQGKFSIIKRNLLYSTADMDYKKLLRQGVEKAISNFDRKIEAGKNICLNLSGGKDSRVVLAMLLQSRNKDKIRALTANPFNLSAGASKDILLKDFNLAAKIIDFYGIEWFKRDNFSEYKLTYDEQLQIWQDFRANSSFELKIKRTQLKNCNELRITGIGGGASARSYLGNSYKQNFPQWAKIVDENPANSDKGLEFLFRSLCHPWLIDEKVYNRAKESFVKNFTFNSDSNALEQLDESYLAYRSRAHSGVGAVHAHEGASLLYPLAQVEFREASLMLEKEQQDHGRLLFDIIAETSPELNYLPFASPAWPAQFKNELVNSSLESKWNNRNITSTEDAYKQGMSASKQRQFYDRGIGDFNEAESSLVRLSRNLDILRSYESDTIDIAPLIQRIARLQQKSLNMLNSLVAKTETMIDVLVPSAIGMKMVLVNPRTNEWQKSERFVYDSKPLELVLKEIDLSEVKVDLLVKSNSQSHSLKVNFQNVPNDCEIALYLYLNGEKKEVLWYEKRDVAEFILEPEICGAARVMSFIKESWGARSPANNKYRN